MIIVTGGAGFIGSALVWALNARARNDILIVDTVDHDEKERNIAPLLYDELIGIQEFREKLLAGEYDQAGVEAIFHLGACSDTTEKNWDYLQENNVEYSQAIIRWCVDRGVRCVYASSAATYGDGTQEYSDAHELFDELKPLNLYGKSKLLVDIWARDAGYLDDVVGLRYFNVFGPNEGHKGHMRSVIAKAYPEVRDKGVMKLYKSYNPAWADGEFGRDFLYVKDAVEMTLFFLDQPTANGVFNCGSGTMNSWNRLAQALFNAVGKTENIEYIDMPKDLQRQYQYTTVADITKLRQAGYDKKMTALETAVKDYVANYLEPDKHLGE